MIRSKFKRLVDEMATFPTAEDFFDGVEKGLYGSRYYTYREPSLINSLTFWTKSDILLIKEYIRQHPDAIPQISSLFWFETPALDDRNTGELDQPGELKSLVLSGAGAVMTLEQYLDQVEAQIELPAWHHPAWTGTPEHGEVEKPEELPTLHFSHTPETLFEPINNGFNVEAESSNYFQLIPSHEAESETIATESLSELSTTQVLDNRSTHAYYYEYYNNKFYNPSYQQEDPNAWSNVRTAPQLQLECQLCGGKKKCTEPPQMVSKCYSPTEAPVPSSSDEPEGPIVEIKGKRNSTFRRLSKKGTKREFLCVFCKGNDEMEDFYKSHPIRVNGIVMCPVLRSLKCKICKATGDNAHTIKYCPQNKRGLFAMKAMDRND